MGFVFLGVTWNMNLFLLWMNLWSVLDYATFLMLIQYSRHNIHDVHGGFWARHGWKRKIIFFEDFQSTGACVVTNHFQFSEKEFNSTLSIQSMSKLKIWWIILKIFMEEVEIGQGRRHRCSNRFVVIAMLLRWCPIVAATKASL